jgi:hypothetical protein
MGAFVDQPLPRLTPEALNPRMRQLLGPPEELPGKDWISGLLELLVLL